MNLRNRLFTSIAAVGLLASIAAPTVTAQPTEDGAKSNQSTAVVEVTASGVFDVYFASSTFDLADVELSASSPNGIASGSFVIVYDDTKAYRPKFDVRVDAQNFQLTTNTSYIIPASGFTISSINGVGQTFWGNSPIDYGDIGYYVNELYPSGQVDPPDPAVPWGPGYSLDVGRKVHFAYEGVGTTLSGGQVNVQLAVPNTTVPGTYNSLMTLSVVSGGQP